MKKIDLTLQMPGYSPEFIEALYGLVARFGGYVESDTSQLPEQRSELAQLCADLRGRKT